MRDDFFVISNLKSSLYIFFLIIFFLNKMIILQDLGFHLFFCSLAVIVLMQRLFVVIMVQLLFI